MGHSEANFCILSQGVPHRKIYIKKDKKLLYFPFFLKDFSAIQIILILQCSVLENIQNLFVPYFKIVSLKQRNGSFF